MFHGPAVDGRRVKPHRSVRFVRFRLRSAAAGLLLAVGLTCGVLAFGPVLMSVHAKICSFLLAAQGIPVVGFQDVSIFPFFGNAAVQVAPASPAAESPERVLLVFSISALALLLVYRRVALARSFIVFLLVLLAVPTAIILLGWRTHFTSIGFAQSWLRLEVLVWLVLPWLSTALLFPVQRSVPKSISELLSLEQAADYQVGQQASYSLGLATQCTSPESQRRMVYA